MNNIPAPPPLSIRDTRGSAMKTLRERCSALGVFTWRCDNSGLILSEPSERGPVGLFLGTRAVAQAVSKAAAAWGKSETPGVCEVFPGAFGVPMPESRRQERTSVTLGLALTDAALSGPFFSAACAEATLQEAAIRRALLPKARFERTSAEGLRDLLMWMGQDLLHVEECDYTIAGFTRQLSDSFETIDVLYAMGRSMSDLANPGEFVENMCARVQQTLSFGWVGVWFGGDAGVPGTLRGRVFSRGPATVTAGIEGEMNRVLAAGPESNGATVLTEIAGEAIAGSGQVLMHPVLRAGKAVGAVMAGDKFGDDPQVSSYDIQLVEAAAGYVGAFIDNAGLYADQRALFLGTLDALTSSIDAKDRYTCGHSHRVAHLSWRLALAAGLNAEEAERVRIAGLVHDVGKIGVPEAVLTKAGKLTAEEFDAIKKHPEIGHKILRDIPLLADVLPGVLHHHERWDGRGYPHNLKGEEIAPMARMIALADTFDAMSSTRSYRAAMSRAQVLAEVQKCAGAQFDPDLAKVFLTLDFAEFDRMVVQHAEANQGEQASVAKAA
jgi:HD-GYP domain-containing protein (c-di-GMP phosphodiesterase class II)